MTNANAAPAKTGALPMSGAELRCLRERLGLTTRWLAEHLDVAERSVHRWEAGVQRVPDGVAAEVWRMDRVARGELAVMGDHLDHRSFLVTSRSGSLMVVHPSVITYRSDEDYRAHHPEQDWPASWHRALCARLADEVPGLRISYWQVDWGQS